MTAQQQALETYFRLMSLNGAARVYRVAQEAGVLAALAQGPAPAEVIAARCGTHGEATTLLLESLVALGVAERQGADYAPAAVLPFLAGDYEQLGDRYWAHLPHFLTTGEPLVRMDDPGQSEQQYQKQAAALAWMLAPAAEAAAQVLDIGGVRRGLTVLDIGAGSAVWSLTFARHDPALRVIAVDWPAVLQIAVAAAQRAGLTDRLTTLPGNYHAVTLPEGEADLAVMGNVTHLETPQGNTALFQRIHQALRPRGELVVFDIFPGQADGDLPRTLYALGLALRTAHGRVYTPEQLMSLLREAGFGECSLSLLPIPPHTVGMLLARKRDTPAGVAAR